MKLKITNLRKSCFGIIIIITIFIHSVTSVMAMENKQIIRNNPFHVMENNASYTRPSELDTLARMDVIEEPRTLSATFLNNADVVQERVSDEKFSNLKSAEENKGEMSLAEKFKIADEQYKTDRFIVK